MSEVVLLGRIDVEEVIAKLFSFYARVEKLLATRLPNQIWRNHEMQYGAREAVESFLRSVIETDLKTILPGVGIYWDDQINFYPIYIASSVALVDLVDGAKEYARQGTNVTSHIGIYAREDSRIGNIQLGIVSYPFHRFRVITFGSNEVYCLSFDDDILARGIREKLDRAKLHRSDRDPHHIVDRYVDYQTSEPLRQALDGLRQEVVSRGGSYVVTRGSVAKTIVDVALGIADIAVCKHDPEARQKIPFSDYLTPSKILENSGGIFTDLDGHRPMGTESIDGFIAAGNNEAYDFLMNSLRVQQ